MIGASKLGGQGVLRPPQSASCISTASVSSAQSRYSGKSLYLQGSGSGDFVSLRSAAPNLFDGEGTVEFWFYNTGTLYPVTYNLIFDIQEVSTEIAILLRNNSGIFARARFGATTYETAQYGASYNNWHHIAITLEENKYLTLWMDGAKKQTIGNGTDTLVTSGGSWWRLGVQSPQAYYNGFRVSKVARYKRTQAVYDLPVAKFRNDPETYMLYHFTDPDTATGLIDDISYQTRLPSFSVTQNGDVTGSNISPPVGGRSIVFDGTGDYLSTAAIEAPSPGAWPRNTDFTAEAFVNPASVGSRRDIICQGGSSDVGAAQIFINTSSKFQAYLRVDGGSNDVNITGTTTVVASTWYHVAFVRRGRDYYLYVNGVLEGSDSTTDDRVIFNSPTRIGTRDGAANYFSGYLAEVRLSTIARYTSNFTPPTSRFKNDVFTNFLLHAPANGVTTFTDDVDWT